MINDGIRETLCSILHMMSSFVGNSGDKGEQMGKKSARKTTRAGGSGMDLQKVAKEQQIILEKEKEERKEQIKAAKEAAAAAAATPCSEVPIKAAPVSKPVVKKPELSKYGRCNNNKAGY